MRSLPTARERLDIYGPAALIELELLTVLLGARSMGSGPAKAAEALLETAPLQELAWAKVEELQTVPGIGPGRAAALAAAFELGRRSGWAPPRRGERLQPGGVGLHHHEAVRPEERPAELEGRGITVLALKTPKLFRSRGQRP